MDRLHLAEQLIYLRHERKITQEQLADFIGVTKASVSKWENRQSLPDMTLLPQLATFFNVTVDELLGYEPQLSKEQIQKLYLELAEAFASRPFDAAMKESRELVVKDAMHTLFHPLFQELTEREDFIRLQEQLKGV